MKKYLFLIPAIILFASINGYSQDDPGKVEEVKSESTEEISGHEQVYTPYMEKKIPDTEEESTASENTNSDTQVNTNNVKQENGVTDNVRE